MRKLGIIAISAAMIFTVACDQKSNNEKTEESLEKELNTDLINNPATAEEGAEANRENLPEFEFEEEVIDFGKISQGEKVKKVFTFTNVGNSNLIISDAKGSCGCTVPIWPREPITPGEEAEIEVVFDSNGKSGRQNKTVTLVANTNPNTKVIAINGDVMVPEKTSNETK